LIDRRYLSLGRATATLLVFLTLTACAPAEPPELLAVRMACDAGEAQACDGLRAAGY
jgi:hypothetical protein